MSATDKEIEGMARVVRNRMQRIAEKVQAELPQGWGFCVLVFRFGDSDVPVQYVSNGQREYIVKTMQEFIDRNPFPKPEEN